MPKKILITEDSPTVLAIMKETLEGEGYSVITAVDGQEALGKARQEKPDLIILDLMLPKMDGYKVCSLLKRDVKYQKIPVIMLTARAEGSDEKLGYECGANAFLTKPFRPEVVIAKIKELLEQPSL